MNPKKAEEGSQGCILDRPEKHIPQTPQLTATKLWRSLRGQNMDFNFDDMGGLKFGEQDIDFVLGGEEWNSGQECIV